MRKHSENALYIAQQLSNEGYKVGYPGLKNHPGHELMKKLYHSKYGFGGMMTIDAGSLAKAERFMELMQEAGIGELAVSLGFYRTLFNAPGTGTSSEVPEEEQAAMGLTPGLVRFSMGLDEDIQHTLEVILDSLNKA
jgi:methionine-gamma-lyase